MGVDQPPPPPPPPPPPRDDTSPAVERRDAPDPSVRTKVVDALDRGAPPLDSQERLETGLAADGLGVNGNQPRRPNDWPQDDNLDPAAVPGAGQDRKNPSRDIRAEIVSPSEDPTDAMKAAVSDLENAQPCTTTKYRGELTKVVDLAELKDRLANGQNIEKTFGAVSVTDNSVVALGHAEGRGTQEIGQARSPDRVEQAGHTSDTLEDQRLSVVHEIRQAAHSTGPSGLRTMVLDRPEVLSLYDPKAQDVVDREHDARDIVNVQWADSEREGLVPGYEILAPGRDLGPEIDALERDGHFVPTPSRPDPAGDLRKVVGERVEEVPYRESVRRDLMEEEIGYGNARLVAIIDYRGGGAEQTSLGQSERVHREGGPGFEGVMMIWEAVEEPVTVEHMKTAAQAYAEGRVV